MANSAALRVCAAGRGLGGIRFRILSLLVPTTCLTGFGHHHGGTILVLLALFFPEDLRNECIGGEFGDIRDGSDGDRFQGLVGRGKRFGEDHSEL